MIYLTLTALIIGIAALALAEYHRAERMAEALRDIAATKGTGSTVRRLVQIAEGAL